MLQKHFLLGIKLEIMPSTIVSFPMAQKLLFQSEGVSCVKPLSPSALSQGWHQNVGSFPRLIIFLSGAQTTCR